MSEEEGKALQRDRYTDFEVHGYRSFKEFEC